MDEKRSGLRKPRTLQQRETIVDETSLLWPIAGKDKNNSLKIGGEVHPTDQGDDRDEGNHKIEFTFHIPEDVPSTYKTKQIHYEVDVSYRVESSLFYREAIQTFHEKPDDNEANGRADPQCLTRVVRVKRSLDFIVLRTLDLKKQSQIEEEVHLVKEKLLTAIKPDSSCSCFLKCVCLRCRCCRSTEGTLVSKSSTQVRDSKGNSFELCLKNADEDVKGGGATQGDVERVWCALHLEKTGFVPGEDINVAAEVRNLSRKLIKASYVSMQQISELHFKISNELKSGSTSQEMKRGLKDIFRISGGVVRTGDTAYYHDIIHIPPLPPTYQTSDQLVGIGYLVTMGIIFDKEDNPLFEVSQPIVVGTIPLSDTHSPWATIRLCLELQRISECYGKHRLAMVRRRQMYLRQKKSGTVLQPLQPLQWRDRRLHRIRLQGGKDQPRL